MPANIVREHWPKTVCIEKHPFRCDFGGPFMNLNSCCPGKTLRHHIRSESAEKELDRPLAVPLLSCRPTNRLCNFSQSTVMQAYRLVKSCHISTNNLDCARLWRYVMSRIRGAWLAALAFLAFFPCNALAQAVYGSIYGTVNDATGALIPNAKIVITDTAKGTQVTATANESGEFRVDHLIPDVYSVSVDNPGFKKYEQNNLQVFADSSVKVDIVLSVGTAGETVEVNASSMPQLKTDRADVAVTYNAQEIQQLPIPDHNFTNLQLLLPGAVQLGWAHAASENPQGSKRIQIDGQAFGGVNYTLDGTDNQDAILGIIVMNPNSESMSEAKIATQNFDAEFGKAVASVQTVQTKSGTNSFHGTLFDNRESNANLARDPFTVSKAAGYPGGLKNQFGGSIGGPILKDKAFFFGDYQGVRQKVGSSGLGTVPSLLALQSCTGATTASNGLPGCDFSQYLTVPGHQLYNNSVPVNPVTGLPPTYPNNIIPLNQLSPQAL